MAGSTLPSNEVWFRHTEPEQLNAMLKKTNCMGYNLGIEFTGITEEGVKARMPVQDNTRQPFGMLHGGASVALAESVGSAAAYLTLKDESKLAVGLSISANHVRPVSEGWVFAMATPLHLGSKTQVWDIHISDDQSRLISTSRLTVAIIDRA
jgi:1,4-dihydroxy-2-naphthoyl-CoA hydrolase